MPCVNRVVFAVADSLYARHFANLVQRDTTFATTKSITGKGQKPLPKFIFYTFLFLFENSFVSSRLPFLGSFLCFFGVFLGFSMGQGTLLVMLSPQVSSSWPHHSGCYGMTSPPTVSWSESLARPGFANFW